MMIHPSCRGICRNSASTSTMRLHVSSNRIAPNSAVAAFASPAIPLCESGCTCRWLNVSTQYFTRSSLDMSILNEWSGNIELFKQA